MANTYKVLGQLNPSANTATTLYTVPSVTSTVCSTITICNQANATASFRIAVRPAGETIDPKHYVAYDTSIPANDVLTMTIGLTLSTTDVVTVTANTANISFNLFGSEIS